MYTRRNCNVLIYGEVQHGGVQRATLHTAGWISLALMVMSLAPSLSRAAIFCLGSEEFEAACEARVQQIHDATEEGRIIVDQLRGSDNIHVVLESNRNSNTMFSVNGYDGGSCGQIAEARGLPLDCTGAGTGDGSF